MSKSSPVPRARRPVVSRVMVLPCCSMRGKRWVERVTGTKEPLGIGRRVVLCLLMTCLGSRALADVLQDSRPSRKLDSEYRWWGVRPRVVFGRAGQGGGGRQGSHHERTDMERDGERWTDGLLARCTASSCLTVSSVSVCVAWTRTCAILVRHVSSIFCRITPLHLGSRQS